MAKKNKFNLKLVVPINSDTIIRSLCEGQQYYKQDVYMYYKYIYVLSRISTSSIMYAKKAKDKKNPDMKDWNGLPIHIIGYSAIMGCCSKLTTEILSNLEAVGLIQKNSGYIPNVKAKGYSLTHIPEEWEVIIPEEQFTKIPQKIIEAYNKKFKTEDITLMKRFFRDLTLPEGLATNVINQYRNNFASVEVIDSLTLSVQEINAKDVRCIRRDGERMHTAVTNLSKSLRKHLHYKGRHIDLDMDGANYQLVILTKFARDYWTAQIGHRDRDLALQEVKEYQQLAESGMFYEQIMEVMEIPENEWASRRKEIKEMVYTDILFGKPFHNSKSKAFNWFKYNFPYMVAAIDGAKWANRKAGGKWWNIVAVTLQRWEAEIFLDKVLFPLLRAGIPCFNVYDSIMCFSEHKDIVYKAITDAHIAYNINPKININENN